MVVRRINAMVERVYQAQDQGLYFLNQPITELRGGARVLVKGKVDPEVTGPTDMIPGKIVLWR